MPAFKINRYFSAGGEYQPVFEKMREIEALSKLLEGFLPSELANLVRVANFKEGKLVLHAANGAAAAKLRLLAESLGACISQQRSQVNSVSVRVQPGIGEVPEREPKQAHLTSAALRELVALYGRLPDSVFRKSLKTLLDRHNLIP